MSEAADHVITLRTAQQSKMTELRAAYSHSISEALRAGLPVPPQPKPTAIDSVALSGAEEQFSSFEASADELAKEAQAAQDEAARHRVEVNALVDAILDLEAHVLGQEIFASTDRTHALMDRLAGMAMRDERRPGGPKLYPMQKDLIERLDRRKAAVKANPLFLETHNWQAHMTDIANAEARKWQGYADRLARDADATYEARGDVAANAQGLR